MTIRAAFPRRVHALAVPLVLAAAALAPAFAESAPASSRAAIRAQSLAALTAGAPTVECLTPLLLSFRRDPAAATAAERRAFFLLTLESALAGERRVLAERGGDSVRFTLDRTSPDRLDPADADVDGQPDVVEAVLEGLAAARRLLVEQMGLPSPGPVEVLLVRLGGGVEGYLLPAGRRDGRPLLVLDASPRGGTAPAATRSAAIHQFAHAAVLAAGPAFPPAFGEGAATWAVMKISGGPDARAIERLAGRLERMDASIDSDDLSLAAGTATWFAFLDESYGLTAVSLAMEELAAGAPPTSALDRALRRASGDTLDGAFREFHLWSVLTGALADGRHFSFADRLPSPAFAADAEGLPALSVQADPPVASHGAAHVRIRPLAENGGMAVRFEGEIGSPWEADLLLIDTAGAMRRVALTLSPESRGETTVPLYGLEQAILLVRNLDGDGQGSHRYTWSVHREPGFPCEIAALDVLDADSPDDAMLVSWETASERSLAGFNVLRRRDGAPGEVRINPILVPPLGDESTAAAYRFVDATAEAGVRYLYRIEAVTPEGLSSFSDAVAGVRAAPAR